jgi:hypothetical protein
MPRLFLLQLTFKDLPLSFYETDRFLPVDVSYVELPSSGGARCSFE